jgi:hypothetical protein
MSELSGGDACDCFVWRSANFCQDESAARPPFSPILTLAVRRNCRLFAQSVLIGTELPRQQRK